MGGEESEGYCRYVDFDFHNSARIKGIAWPELDIGIKRDRCSVLVKCKEKR